MNDAVGGQVDAITDNLPSVIGHIKASRLRPLAVMAEKRSPTRPDDQAIHKAMRHPDFVRKMDESGVTLIPGTPAEFSKQIQQALERYQRVVKVANVRVE